ncbi:MAG: virulence RhuM family protein [Treponema sp.]|nr:virulence RhuM family protein [Treponema sp.]
MFWQLCAVLFESKDKGIKLSVPFNNETVWLSQRQMIELFERDQSVISKHIKNVFAEEEVDQESNMQILHITNSDKPVVFYSLDVIISVGYRVKSKRGTEFRRWANTVLKQYILNGYAANQERLSQLNQTIQLIKRLELQTDNQLDDYDHQKVNKPDRRKVRELD